MQVIQTLISNMSMNFIYLTELLDIVIGLILMLLRAFHAGQFTLCLGKLVMAFTVIFVISAYIAVAIHI